MIQEKLQVLRTADIIDQETMQMVLTVQSYLSDGLHISSEKMETFLIHLAMADMRRKRHEDIDLQMEADLVRDIESHVRFEEAKALWLKLTQFTGSRDFDAGELDFFYLHLLALFEEG